MPVTVSYPGVYVAEDASPSLSVSTSATAVPMIAMYDLTAGQGAVKINSYFDYVYFIGGQPGDNDDDNFMRAYFENGGGPCYIANYTVLLDELPKYDDVTLIVAAGRGDSTFIADMYSLCTDGSGLFLIADYPRDSELTTSSTWPPEWSPSSHAATYYPWLLVDWATNSIAPSVVAAALYCKTDRTRGVWKAPANIALPANYQPQFKVTDDLQGQYNDGQTTINMIRSFNNDAPVIWGARTLDDSDSWRYIPVRRLFDSAERDIKRSLQLMVFEPNNQPTWEKVRSAITNYLHSLWRQGALVGATESEAYFVQIGEGITMTADDIAQGKMIANVGMAAVRPAEFIVLQFTQNIEVTS